MKTPREVIASWFCEDYVPHSAESVVDAKLMMFDAEAEDILKALDDAGYVIVPKGRRCRIYHNVTCDMHDSPVAAQKGQDDGH